MNQAPQNLCGWRDDGGHAPIASTMPRFATVARGLMGMPRDDRPVLLYKAWADVLGKYPEYAAQQIGDCVSHGHGHANDLLQCIEISLGEASEFQPTDTEFIYGESRKVAGILGNSDGSYGSAAVKAMTTVGMVSRAMLGSDGEYSGQRAKAWGRTGPPAEIEAKAADYKLGNAALVGTWDELVASLGNGYPVTICTAAGFTMTRDSNGFCRRFGRWGHCMFVAAVRFDIPGACIAQSWGPGTPEGPTALDQPHFSFWVSRQDIESILSEGDSWALSKSPDFLHRDTPARWSFEAMA